MIELRLETAEVNLLLHALAQRPYAEIHELIAKVHMQATEQAKTTKAEASHQ